MGRAERETIFALIERMKQAAKSELVNEISVELKALIAENSVPEVTLSGPKTRFVGNTMVVEMGD